MLPTESGWYGRKIYIKETCGYAESGFNSVIYALTFSLHWTCFSAFMVNLMFSWSEYECKAFDFTHIEQWNIKILLQGCP